MSRKLAFFSTMTLFVFLLAACDASASAVEVSLSEPLDQVTFLDEEEETYDVVHEAGTYVISGIIEGDHIVPVHDTYAFSPEVIIVEELDTPLTFEVIDPDDNDEGDDSEQDEDPIDDSDGDADQDVPSDDEDTDQDEPSDDEDTDQDEPSDDEDSDQDDSSDDGDTDQDTPSDDGDGDQEESMSVVDAAAFDAAVQDDSVQSIVLNESIEDDLAIDRLVTIDFNGEALTGDLTIQTEEEGTMELLDGTMNGTLTIDAQNATVHNHLGVEGQVLLLALASESYDDYHTNNLVFIEGVAITATFHNGAQGVYIKGDDTSVQLDEAATIHQLSILDEAQDVSVTNAANINHAIVDNATAFFDGLPSILSGSELPAFEGTVIENFETEIDESFPSDATLDDVEASLPNEITVMTTDGTMDVGVEWLFEGIELDEDAEWEQTLFIPGAFLDLEADDLINAKFLQPFAEIVIEAPEPEDVPLLSTVLIDSTIETSLDDVDTLQDVEALLPDTVLTTYNEPTSGTVDVDVEWALDEGTFEDESYAGQTLVFEGTLTNIPQGYSNPDDLTLSITVTIEPLDEVVSEDPFYIGSNHSDGLEIDYEIDDFSVNQWVDVSITVDQEYVFSHYEDYYTGEPFEPFSGPQSLEFSEFYESGETFHIKAVLTPVERPDINTLYGGGSGTENDPFLIGDTTHLSNMRYYLDHGYHFQLENNIVFDEDETFNPMRSQNDYPFNGVLDGNGHVIDGYAVDNVDCCFDYTGDDDLYAFIRDNDGVIKNLSFTNVQVGFEDTGASSGVLVHTNHGTIRDVSIDGEITAHKASSFADRNFGTIRDVSADVTMHEPYAGLVATNYGTLRDASIDGTFHYTRRFSTGAAGVVRTNRTDNPPEDEATYPGLISNVQGDLSVRYDFDKTESFDFGGFVHSSLSGSLIEDSSLNISVINDGDHDADLIAGFIVENAGTIDTVDATGSIEGGSTLGGFAYHNRANATMTHITSDVDVYASEGGAAGFVYWNDKVFDNEGYIGDSLTSGDVYTDGTPRSAFIVQSEGTTDNITRNGDVYDYPE